MRTDAVVRSWVSHFHSLVLALFLLLSSLSYFLFILTHAFIPNFFLDPIILTLLFLSPAFMKPLIQIIGDKSKDRVCESENLLLSQYNKV